jgi:CRISPR-associated endonuclease Cas1
MAAVQTVPQHLQHCNFVPILPRHGVITLFGYGIKVCVDRGHLTIEDGIGSQRRYARFPRVGHGLRRLVVIGSDGMVSLAGLRWLADQGAAFVMLERDGKVLATTGPVRPSDARLRRAQALAHNSGIALRIARELIHQKLVAQEYVVRKYFLNESAAQAIVTARNTLPKATTSDEMRVYESQAALAYWGAWRKLEIIYPRNVLNRIPDHWKRFGSRLSPLTKSPRLAINPPNAMLNYLYALLESEARLALAALGLDPGIGVLHNDTRTRDSLACDLMEPVRPQVDAYLLDWLSRAPLHREWFFEQRDGNCRLMSSLASRLSETSHIWAEAVAPFAEGITQTLWSMTSKRGRSHAPATRLTQSRKREAKGSSFVATAKSISNAPALCRICGVDIKAGFKYCRNCVPTISKENILEASKLGRLATHKPEAQARRAETQRRQNAALKAWNPADKPKWLDQRTYDEKIKPRLTNVIVPRIMSALSISEPYALRIRGGKCIPHPRHWLALAKLTGKIE